MRVGKSVDNGSNGGSVSGGLVEGLSHASKDSVKSKIVGSSKLAPNVVGASPGPFGPARGNATPPNDALSSGTPDPEVRIKRRRLTREYKIQILKDLDKFKGKPGAVGEFLRKEGLYSATVAYWKKQRNEGTLGKTRGRKPRSEEVLENEKLKKVIARLEEKNRQYVLVIEAQKKISEILGIRQDNVPPMPEEDQDE
jgi:transposase-like protein